MTYENYKKAIDDSICRNIDIETITDYIYNACKDLDFNDYTEMEETEKNEITETLYYLKACADNEMNHNYFRTFILALATMCGGI